MTREEAAKRWEWVIENFNDSSVYLWPDQRQELLASIALLRGTQPDPITGLVPCGCGGKAQCSVTCYVCSRGADGGCGHWANCSRAYVKHEDYPHDQDLYDPKPYCDRCGRKLKEDVHD